MPDRCDKIYSAAAFLRVGFCLSGGFENQDALVVIEKHCRPGAPWFQTIGRNTFPIYVSHIIVLYGGIFGIGLNDWLENLLNPWQAALGAVLFCGFFAVCAQWVEPLTLRWKNWRYPLRGRD